VIKTEMVLLMFVKFTIVSLWLKTSGDKNTAMKVVNLFSVNVTSLFQNVKLLYVVKKWPNLPCTLITN
jgi:hypothetical protein